MPESNGSLQASVTLPFPAVAASPAGAAGGRFHCSGVARDVAPSSSPRQLRSFQAVKEYDVSAARSSSSAVYVPAGIARHRSTEAAETSAGPPPGGLAALADAEDPEATWPRYDQAPSYSFSDSVAAPWPSCDVRLVVVVEKLAVSLWNLQSFFR